VLSEEHERLGVGGRQGRWRIADSANGEQPDGYLACVLTLVARGDLRGPLFSILRPVIESLGFHDESQVLELENDVGFLPLFSLVLQREAPARPELQRRELPSVRRRWLVAPDRYGGGSDDRPQNVGRQIREPGEHGSRQEILGPAEPLAPVGAGTRRGVNADAVDLALQNRLEHGLPALARLRVPRLPAARRPCDASQTAAYPAALV